MTIDGSIDYALSRVHAQYGRRPDAALWSRLEGSRGIAHYLDVARSSTLSIWVASLEPSQDTHTLERTFRQQWRRYVEAVARWHPLEWQPWLAWLQWLPILTLLAQLAGSERVPPWMLADPLFGSIALGTLEERRRAVAKHAALAPLEPGISGAAPIGALWRTRWQMLAPRSDEHTVQLLGSLVDTLEDYVHALAGAVGTSTPLREQLDHRLRRLFRAASGTVVATVCLLALLALDLERLRGGLVTRAVFGTVGETA